MFSFKPMTTIAKKALAALLLCLATTIAVVAQKNDATFQSNGYTFPILTMDKLMRYCDMDSLAFDSVMRSFDFAIEENIYTKGTLDKSKMVFGKSKQFGTSIVWVSNDNNISVVDKLLEKFTHPSNVSVADGFSFMYKKYVISVKSSKSGINYEEINIIDKANYKNNQEN